jgi:hypothetical protein
MVRQWCASLYWAGVRCVVVWASGLESGLNRSPFIRPYHPALYLGKMLIEGTRGYVVVSGGVYSVTLA